MNYQKKFTPVQCRILSPSSFLGYFALFSGIELPDMSGKFRYICEICGKKFYLSHDCKRHKQLVHGDKILQVCVFVLHEFVTDIKFATLNNFAN